MVITGTVASTSDVDVFKFSVPAASQVTVVLAPNALSNYDLSVYNSTGQLLITSRQTTGRAETIALTNMGKTAAVLYFQVNRVLGLSGATGTYSLTFKK
jgi:serine protease